MSQDGPIEVTRPTDREFVTGGDRRLRHDRSHGQMLRLRRGVYVPVHQWERAAPPDRMLAAIRGTVATRRGQVVLSHGSAALLHGLPLAHYGSLTVHITEPPSSTRRSTNGLRVHRRELDPARVVHIGDFLVTDIAQTVVDLARDSDFVDAVVAADHVLSRDRRLITREDLLAAARSGERPGMSRAMALVEFATDLAESPLESESRLRIRELGFPDPILQHEVVTRRTVRRLDFWWDEFGVGGEADGMAKYADDPLGTLRAEKQREAELFDVGVRLVRWGAAECREPALLAQRLRAAGLPRTSTPLPPPVDVPAHRRR